MTTPAEKDAMALAVLAAGAQHLRNAKNIKACHLGDAASELEQARAHLAARVAELEKMLVDYEQDYPPTVRALRESTGRATRAEAELAEFKKNNRWNVRETDSGLAVCRGDHDKSQGCEEVLYVRADEANAELAAVRATANAFSMTVAAAMKEGAICKEHRAAERMIDAGLELNRIVLKSYADAARGAG